MFTLSAFYIRDFYMIFVKRKIALKKTFQLLLLLACITSNSQSIRKYSNEFMNIGVDAAALGMSNAVTASTNNVNSGYWNPAGMI